MSVPWELVASFIGLTVFICGLLFGAIKWLLSSYQKEMNRHMDQRFTSLEQAINSHKSQVDDVRNELKDFKTEVARAYVDRETFVRVEGGHELNRRITSQQLEEIKEMIHALRSKN